MGFFTLAHIEANSCLYHRQTDKTIRNFETRLRLFQPLTRDRDLQTEAMAEIETETETL